MLLIHFLLDLFLAPRVKGLSALSIRRVSTRPAHLQVLISLPQRSKKGPRQKCINMTMDNVKITAFKQYVLTTEKSLQ